MRPKPVFEFNLFTPRWHGWARWDVRRLEYRCRYLYESVTLHSGYVRRPRGSEYLVVRSYDGAGLPWNNPC